MDADSQDFSLDFGPNSLTIRGEVINARLRGVQAKRFTYDVVDGELLAEDISTTVSGGLRLGAGGWRLEAGGLWVAGWGCRHNL